MPKELSVFMREKEQLKSSFNGLPLYKQRGYAEFIRGFIEMAKVF